MARSRIIRYLIPTTSLMFGTFQSFLQSVDTQYYIYKYGLISNPDTKIGIENSQFKKNKHAHLIINQAFSDAGCKGKVYFDVDMYDSDNMCTTAIYKLGTKTEAFVGTSKKTINENSDEVIYAMAAHEAFHIKHHHGFIKNFLYMYLYLSLPFLFFNAPKKIMDPLIKSNIKNRLFYKSSLRTLSCSSAIIAFSIADYLYNQVEKLCEIDANVSAAIKLGVPSLLIAYFNKDLKNTANQGRNFYSDSEYHTHPHPNTRINYLSFLEKTGISNTPLLYKSETYHNILKEREINSQIKDNKSSKLTL